MTALSKIDLVFCVDLTGSMAGFLTAAKRDMSAVLEALASQLEELRVGIVGYRDHCDGDKLVEIHPLDGNLKRVAKQIDKLAVSGGGDAPEAVYSGLRACLGLDWAPGTYRVILLVGDAPPHGVGAPGDSHAKGDPTGLSLDDMANLLEAEGVFVHALSMQPADQILAVAFRRLSISTGGGFHDTSSGGAMAIVKTIGDTLLQEIELDTRLLERLRLGVRVPVPSHDNEVVPSQAQILAELLHVPERDIHAGMMRLRRRGLE
jgi:hypothetical protein